MASLQDIEDLHDAAVLHGRDTYVDPETKFTVFTKLSHLRRGKCCGSGCRHCPYAHQNVNEQRRASLPARINTAARRVQGGAEGRPPVLATPFDSSDDDDDDDEEEATGKATLKVYTRTGDSGSSQLFTGERRSKDDSVFEAMGTVDELSSFVGLSREECSLQGDSCASITSDLEGVLRSLLDVGSNIATPLGGRGAASKRARTSFGVEGAAAILKLEHRIDELSAGLPPVRATQL